MEKDEMYTQAELLEMYSDVIEGGSYLLANCGKGYVPRCEQMNPVTGECLRWSVCN